MTVTNQGEMDLQQTAVCLAVHISKLNIRRKVMTEEIVDRDVDADKTMIHVSKEILDSPELKAIGKLEKQIRDYVMRWALPSPLKRGINMYPIAILPQLLAGLDEFREEWNPLVAAFLDVYEKRKKEAPDRLGPLFDAADYPSIARVHAAFAFDVTMLEISPSSALKGVSMALYREELRKYQQMWDAAKAEIAGALYQEMHELVGHLAERLANDPTGKRKTFKASTVTKFQEWIDVFEARNLTKDADLSAMVRRARDLIGGMDADTIRESDGLRKDLAAEFTEIKRTLDAAVMNRTTRAIAFDEE